MFERAHLVFTGARHPNLVCFHRITSLTLWTLTQESLPEKKSRQPQEQQQQQQQQTQRRCPKRPDLPYMTTTTHHPHVPTRFPHELA